ncbi:MAG: peptidase M2 family protein [Alphaproteobacteria bacterium]|nr:peptidase M2 family protein [Alphaproteobacteria bacterium]
MRKILLAGAAACALALAGCSGSGNTGAAANKPTVADADKFLADAESQLGDMYEYASHTAWVNENFITYDTDWLNSRASSEVTQLGVKLAVESEKFKGLDLPQDEQRKIMKLRTASVMPSPSGDKKVADELATITTRMQSEYGAGKFTVDGKALNLEELSNIVGESRDPAKLKQVWEGWRTVSPPMKADYARMVEIGNQGAQELGFKNIADMWLSTYDMPPDQMEQTVEKLWTQVQPLYTELHCYVRTRLNQKYGDAVQPKTGPIRADLLGNMWAQDWSNIYPLVAPRASDPGYDLTSILKAKGYDAMKMVKTGEGFYTSLGFDPLPKTFWERSLITRPRDREVVCHASAWDIDNVDDIRIKMCTQVNAEDFQTVHHELGHNFYQRAYDKQDILFRDGANDGFHEAIGDFIALSVTPEYLKQLGLISKVPGPDADIGLLMNRALEKVAFLPFGLRIDKWRWQVFRGQTTPDQYNDAWWALAKQYQGIVPPGPRPADAFDPGAKFHIAANTPYLRYFLSYILQFQFQKAACEQAGWTGPLHRCSIYGNKEVGAKFKTMLEMGASKPWPDALEAFTGTREIDGTAMVDYFAPLMTYLKQQNEGQSCGW